jgi:phosphomannomutase
MNHTFHPSLLRAYDIRGTFEKTLFVRDAHAIGRTFGEKIKQGDNHLVVVGYDGRLSSPVLEQAVVDGLLEAGVRVLRVGLGPTPMLYYAAKALEAGGGIMITGSHNPPQDNGFKMVMHQKPFYGEAIQELGTLAAADLKPSPVHGTVKDHPILEQYVKRLLQGLNFGKRPLKLAWDAGNGAAGEVMVHLTRALPGQHYLLNAKIDGHFPSHHPDPTVPENLVQLMELVKAQGCDAGIAFDGDGDRLGVVDNEGNIIWGDQLVLYYAKSLLKEQPKATIIADVKSSNLLFEQVAAMGGQALMWKTGHSLIKVKMQETGAALAGEISGHIFFADRWYGFDDALYAALRFMECLSHEEGHLSTWYHSLPKVYNTPEIRLDCPDEEKFSVMERLKELAVKDKLNVNDIDGVRVSGEAGWWLIRASNTQPVLVARCESTSAVGLEKLKAQLQHYLETVGITAPWANAA